MDLAVRTTASPAAIWAIVIVAVVCLAFWLIMVMVYANRPDPRRRLLADMPGPVLGGIHMAAGGRSVSPTRDASAVLGEDFLTDLSAAPPQPGQPGATAPEPEAARVPDQHRPAAPAEPAPAAGAAGPTAEAPTEPIPAQRSAAADTPSADTAGSGADGRA